MKLKKHKHIIILIILFVVYFLFEIFKLEPTDWSPNFKRQEKIPYGTYIIYDLLPDIFSSEISKNSISLYQLLHNKELSNTNLILINKTIAPDKLDTEQLLAYVEAGNNVFMAANSFGKILSDTLNIDIDMRWELQKDTIGVNFVNPILKEDTAYFYLRSRDIYYFTSFDTVNTTILGNSQNNEIHFIKIRFGNGNFFINIQPYAFTNYYLLKDNCADYAFKALSYLPDNKVIWDEFYKPKNVVETPLRYILSDPPLKTAYLLLISLMAIYVVFEMKRQQRIIPIIKPMTNTSLEFIETIGKLYFHTSNHKDIALKKFNYFHELVQTKYFINIKLPIVNEQVERIAEKTGANKETVETIFKLFDTINKNKKISDKELLTFNQSIETFYFEAKFQHFS